MKKRRIYKYQIWLIILIAGASLLFRAANTGTGSSLFLRIFSAGFIILVLPATIIGIKQSREYKKLPNPPRLIANIALVGAGIFITVMAALLTYMYFFWSGPTF